MRQRSLAPVLRASLLRTRAQSTASTLDSAELDKFQPNPFLSKRNDTSRERRRHTTTRQLIRELGSRYPAQGPDRAEDGLARPLSAAAAGQRPAKRKAQGQGGEAEPGAAKR